MTVGAVSAGSLAAAPIAGPGPALAPEDDSFLDGVEKASYLYFWEQAHPETGLVKDRAKANTSDSSMVLRFQHQCSRCRPRGKRGPISQRPRCVAR